MIENLNTYEDKVEANIREHGHAVINTMSDSKTSPVTLSYTVGLSQKGTSDLMMMGFKHEMMHGLLNDTVKLLDKGDLIKDPRRLSKVIQGFDVLLQPVPKLDAARFAYALKSHSKGSDLNLVQVFLPDPQGRFPDDEGCDIGYARMQNHLRLIPNS
ncbi:DUF4262 domain-containing protein [Sulfitobacter sp. R18_1]|uniref:DUF4262 domain-containing protein n=1 Tax=Sulfitobacter sp. R18_1 TaxID=2821104 RepID=UPI001ADAC7B2|nr:DUF4262 domain-containing protein [Sulfitobacter sp. R18_1]MBO9428062.1 DUF4262 domain-containing protein [Sulfitobacter sp. R18_1]